MKKKVIFTIVNCSILRKLLYSVELTVVNPVVYVNITYFGKVSIIVYYSIFSSRYIRGCEMHPQETSVLLINLSKREPCKHLLEV